MSCWMILMSWAFMMSRGLGCEVSWGEWGVEKYTIFVLFDENFFDTLLCSFCVL